MLSNVPAERVRLCLAQSLALVESRREDRLRGLQNKLVAFEKADEPFGEGDVAAMTLLDLLIACAGDIVRSGAIGNLEQAASDHGRLGISGRHYSRFGMSLAPALRETLGTRIPPRAVAAWCDTFWLVVRSIADTDEGLVIDEYLQVIR